VKNKKKVLKNKKILLGVAGGVAAYKSVDLVRRLKDEGASVTVIMTDASKNFITPLSLEIASGNRVCSGVFDDPMSHINLPMEADIMLIAPATANIIGKFANGIADDLLSTCFLSFKGKVVIAPSMNWRMYDNPIFQENLRRLRAHGVIQAGPDKGTLACGEEGIGRMADAGEIIETIKSAFSKKDFFKKKVIVTAGPTREYLDPVRFLSNRSSGKMGYAIARAYIRRGAEVTLISGPSCLEQPRKGVAAEKDSGKEGKPILFIAGGLLLYLALMKVLGFYTDTFLLLVYLMRCFGEKRYWRSVALSLIIIVVVYFIFYKVFIIPFPEGMIGL